MNTHIPPAQVLCSWEAPARLPVTRSQRWYVVAAVFVVLLGVYAIATAAWSFAVVILLGTGLYITQHRREPPVHRVTVRTDGMTFDGAFIPWVECSGFWMLQGGDYIEVFIDRKASLRGPIRILTGEEDPVRIFGALAECLPHFPQRREGVLDAIIRICKL